jgi:hypothetical protein
MKNVRKSHTIELYINSNKMGKFGQDTKLEWVANPWLDMK